MRAFPEHRSRSDPRPAPRVQLRAEGHEDQVKGEEAVWNRSDVEVSVENTTATQRITIKSRSGDEQVVLDSGKGGGGKFNQALLELLGAQQPG